VKQIYIATSIFIPKDVRCLLFFLSNLDKVLQMLQFDDRSIYLNYKKVSLKEANSKVLNH